MLKMFQFIFFVCILLYEHRTDGGFLRFNDPDHITAPLDLEDLQPGSYDDLIQYNPSLGDPYESISYGGDRNKPFDWSAPEIEAQSIRLVLEPGELPFNGEKETIKNPFSLPYLAKRSSNASKTEFQDINVVNNTIDYNETDKIENGSSTISPVTRTTMADSHLTLNLYNSLLFKKKPKYRTYRITTPEYEWTYHGFDDLNNRFADHDYTLEGSYISSCYRCGELNYGKWWRPSVERRERNGKIIPNNMLCSEVFGDNWEYKTKARYLRSRCYNNEKQQYEYKIGYDNYNYYHECVMPQEYVFGRNHTKDRGNPVECFARYTGRCFKRFLDVGKEYTERGCASWPPHQSNSFASHRFTKMEYLLFRKDKGCVSSPLASLTPFARSVSLYVRYHVCVCTGKYCNVGTSAEAAPLLLLFTSYHIIQQYVEVSRI